MAVQPNVKGEPARAQARTPSPALKKGEYLGRNGRIIRRPQKKSHNPFDFPEEIKESGWSYQWCRADVLGSPDFSEIALMRRAGWDYVKPDQLEGYFQDDCKGMDHIEVAGMVLMERPEGMTKDARDEQLREANERYAMVLKGRADNEAPLPDGVIPIAREIYAGQKESSNSMKPTYARVAAPAGDDE